MQPLSTGSTKHTNKHCNKKISEVADNDLAVLPIDKDKQKQREQISSGIKQKRREQLELLTCTLGIINHANVTTAPILNGKKKKEAVYFFHKYIK